MNQTTHDIHICGLVQGVGFRPFIYRLANEMGMKGWVENRNDGVRIRVTCTESALRAFIEGIRNRAPEAADIYSIDHVKGNYESFDDFRIKKSENLSDDITEISPDIAVCDACLEDMKRQPHRIGYPFINCTNCGPRFTIIRDLPYDRDKTTMEPFVMCDECHAEYTSVLDRRFHAQPVACNNCGPTYELLENGKRTTDLSSIISTVCRLLENGKILTIKGMGGFFLACDATNKEAVSKLRALKKREGKPFAVMVASLDTAREFAFINPAEEKLLLSWRRPIVLLRERKKLAPDVNVGFDTIGIMLPYMPFHYLLFEKLKLKVIVLTSGNLSDEPILIDNNRTIEQLNHLTDAILIYNREIYNRTDDSVVMVVNGVERLIRRSRGYVPAPVRMNMFVDGILAAGAELVNCFCIGKGKQAFLSQHIGDLKNLETYEFYQESVDHFSRMFRFTPALVAADLHPDYLSTRFAHELKVPVTGVQHHHAHIASCMAEHGLDDQVIGIAFDGVGYGEDGHIWGGEFLICSLESYQRYTHFDYVPMPGGDRATEEPWRMAVSYLYRTFGRAFLDMDLPFLRYVSSDVLELVLAAIEKQINCPLTSSAGRLFDAVSALTGLCTVSGFHAEAPMRLEAAADEKTKACYEVVMDKTIHFEPMIEAIVRDLTRGILPSIISAKFHNTIIDSALETVTRMRSDTGIRKVALSGGSFQNRYLSSRLEDHLQQKGFQVYSNHRVPANDGGIALGQLAVAAKRYT
ncbi:MAG: carbamoyltransferase HypF [Bacteroidales bacterium]|nr:carbamoyltransferase HypF [Bacteroidales bacterium]